MTVNRQSGMSVIRVHGHLWGSLTEGTDSVAGKFCSNFLEASTNEFFGRHKNHQNPAPYAVLENHPSHPQVN